MSSIPDPPPSLMRLFFRMGGWFVLMFGVVLLVLSLIGQDVLNTAERFEREGRSALAEVTDKFIRESRDSDGDRTLTRYLAVSFTTQGGELIRVEKSVGSRRYRETSVGDQIELLYLKSLPTRTEIDRGSHKRGSVILQGLALGFGLAWLAALWVVGGWAVAAVRARRYGRLEQVKVSQVLKTGIQVNKQPRFRL